MTRAGQGNLLLTGALLPLLLCALVSGCRDPRPLPPPPNPAAPEEVADLAQAAPFTPPEGFTRLRLVATPYLEPQLLLRSHEPLAAHLSERLGVPVELVPARTYDEVGDLLRRGEADLGSFSPLAYVRARAKDEGLTPLASVIADGSATAAGYIVVRAEGGITSLEDLRGKRFAWVDPSSTSGFLYPRALLLQRGLDPDVFFGETAFLRSHDAALLAVHRGEFDATATYQGALPALQRSAGIDPLEFRIVAKTLRAPKDVFCARSGLPPEVQDRLRQVLLALSVQDGKGRAILGPLRVNGFIPADDALYDEVRQVDEALATSR